MSETTPAPVGGDVPGGSPHPAPTNPVPPPPPDPSTWSKAKQRKFVFWWQVGVTLFLWLLAYVYARQGATASAAFTVGGIHTGVLWYGALGAVTISLAGVVEHDGDDWESRFFLWHLSRPLVGASFALVSVLIFKAGIASVGSGVAPSGTPYIYFLIAFLVGFRESTFRSLVKKLVDVVMGPGESDTLKAPTISKLDPPSGKAAGGDSIHVQGDGFDGSAKVMFGKTEAKIEQVSGTLITVTLPQGAAGDVPVTVSTRGGSCSRTFTYT